MNEHRNNPDNLPSADDDLGPFESELSDRMHHSIIDLPAAKGAGAAADRAHARTRQRRGVLAGAAAMALVAGVVTTTMVGDDGSSPLDTAGTMNIDNNGVNLDWQVTDDGLSSVRSYSGTDAGLYAMSTSPGARWEDYPDGDAPRAMYRLADDGTWQAIELGDDDPKPGRISERAGTLYALSTGADTGEPVGSMSTDGGESWTSVPLGAIEPPSHEVGWEMYYRLNLASTNDVTLGLVTAQFHLPGDEVFPELGEDRDRDPEAEYYWDYTDDGVTLFRVEYRQLDAEEVERLDADGTLSASDDRPFEGTILEDPDGRVVVAEADVEDREEVRTVLWSELGLTGPDDLVRPPSAYLVDGESWTVVDVPVDVGGDYSLSLSSTGDHLVLAHHAYGYYNPDIRGTVHHSADGVEWVETTGPGQGWTVTAGPGLVHTDFERDDRLTVSASTDLGATWHEIDFTGLDPRLEDMEGDGFSLFGGPLGVAAIVTDWNEDGPGTSLLLFSSDLRSWTVTDLSEVSPDSNYFAGVLVGTDRIVVQGEGDPNGDDPQLTQTLIATPTR